MQYREPTVIVESHGNSDIRIRVTGQPGAVEKYLKQYLSDYHPWGYGTTYRTENLENGERSVIISRDLYSG